MNACGTGAERTWNRLTRARAWGGFCEELVGFLRSHYLRILRASAVHLRSIICAFLPSTPNAPDAEGWT